MFLKNLQLFTSASQTFRLCHCQEVDPERKKSKKVKKNAAKKAKGKASFKRDGRKVGVVAPVSDTPPAHEFEPEDMFLGYDLSPLPKDAYPDRRRVNQGKLSYTIEFSNARVEVLLAKKAYFVKSVAPGFPGPKGQITWSKFGGPKAAWDLVKERSGFNRPWLYHAS